MTAPRGLHTLARLHGVQTAYYDNHGRRITASPEALLAALEALRAGVGDTSRIPDRVESRRRALWERLVPPVTVAWTGPEGGRRTRADSTVAVRTPERLRDRPLEIRIRLEEGGELDEPLDPGHLEVSDSAEVGGTRFIERRLPLPTVPVGYHDLVVQVGRGAAARQMRSLLIAAPLRARGWETLPGTSERKWGVFAPLHALWREGDPEAPPSFGLLAELAEQVADAGGDAVGTLPVLAAFLDEPYEPSPYSPVSRLFWNELYVDTDGAAFRRRVRTPTDGDREDRVSVRTGYFDPASAMARRRSVLEEESRRFFEGRGTGTGADRDGRRGEGRPAEMAAFLSRNPMAEDYARFRAVTESRGEWQRWPERLRAGDVRPGDYPAATADYHLYAQWRAERELAEVAEQGEARGVSLYLDLPLGVDPRGYDTWRFRSLFADGITAGAPPDPLALRGQDWGFRPLHPEASAEDGHRYFISSIRKHLRFARVLRIDHVMQLERLYWVVTGDATDGVYVRYPAEALYAVLCLESARAGAVIVGEDLGTVPRSVRRSMRRHSLPGMYVLQFELEDTEADGEPALEPRPPGPDSLASIGTHDTPTFAGWWRGRDIEIRRSIGQLDEEETEAQLEGRGIMRGKLVRGLGLDRGVPADRVHEVLLRHMGRSDAGLVLATMEDLWLEEEPQNVPGTVDERNWRRRSARPLDALDSDGPDRLLTELNAAREGTQ